MTKSANSTIDRIKNLINSVAGRNRHNEFDFNELIIISINPSNQNLILTCAPENIDDIPLENTTVKEFTFSSIDGDICAIAETLKTVFEHEIAITSKQINDVVCINITRNYVDELIEFNCISANVKVRPYSLKDSQTRLSYIGQMLSLSSSESEKTAADLDNAMKLVSETIIWRICNLEKRIKANPSALELTIRLNELEELKAELIQMNLPDSMILKYMQQYNNRFTNNKA